MNVLGVMGEDKARDMGWLRARGITCVSQTPFSSCCFFFFFFFFFWKILLVCEMIDKDRINIVKVLLKHAFVQVTCTHRAISGLRLSTPARSRRTPFPSIDGRERGCIGMWQERTCSNPICSLRYKQFVPVHFDPIYFTFFFENNSFYGVWNRSALFAYVPKPDFQSWQDLGNPDHTDVIYSQNASLWLCFIIWFLKNPSTIALTNG